MSTEEKFTFAVTQVSNLSKEEQREFYENHNFELFEIARKEDLDWEYFCSLEESFSGIIHFVTSVCKSRNMEILDVLYKMWDDGILSTELCTELIRTYGRIVTIVARNNGYSVDMEKLIFSGLWYGQQKERKK